MNKNILLLGLLLFSPSLLFAQKKILSEKVEVTKSYVPKIGKASKRDIQPQTEETLQIEVPKLKYSITYKPEKYPFVINALDVPSYKIIEPERLYNGYADLSLGVPFSTKFNLFYTSTELRNTIFGASLGHNGFWGKLEDAKGVKRSAGDTQNDLSLFFEYQAGELRTKITATESYDSYKRYGYNTDVVSKDNSAQHFMKTAINAEIGTTFEDMNKFNINLALSMNLVSDKYSYNTALYQAGVLMSKGFKKINSRIEGRVEYLSEIPTRDFNIYPIWGEVPVERPVPQPGEEVDMKYSPTGILSVAPRYIFNYKGLDASVGVNMNFDFNGNDNNYRQGVSTFLPQLDLSYSFLSGGLRPYAKIDGKYISNNYYTLIEQNPYIVEGLTAPNTVIRRYMVGIGGNIRSNFNYDVYVGLRQSRDLLMFVNIEQGNIFSTLRGDFDNTEIGVELGYILNSAFTFNLKANYIDYDNTGALDDNIAIGHAPLTANLMVNYFPTKKLLLSLGGEFQSERKFGSIVKNEAIPDTDLLIINKVGAVFDLSLMAEYRISKRMAVSLKGGNLLNQKLYPYNNYRGIGVNVLGGVSYKF